MERGEGKEELRLDGLMASLKRDFVLRRPVLVS